MFTSNKIFQPFNYKGSTKQTLSSCESDGLSSHHLSPPRVKMSRMLLLLAPIPSSCPPTRQSFYYEEGLTAHQQQELLREAPPKSMISFPPDTCNTVSTWRWFAVFFLVLWGQGSPETSDGFQSFESISRTSLLNEWRSVLQRIVIARQIIFLNCDCLKSSSELSTWQRHVTETLRVCVGVSFYFWKPIWITWLTMSIAWKVH